MELVLFIIYLLVWLGLTLRRKRTEGYFSVFFVFGLSGLAYFSLIPMEMYLTGEEYYFVHYWVKLGSIERNLILFMSIISLFGFYIGLKLSRYHLFPAETDLVHDDIRPNKGYFAWIIGLLSIVIITCGMILILFYRELLLSQYDYTSAYRITYESPLYSFIKMHFLIGLALMAGVLMRKRYSWVGMTFCLVIVALIVLAGMLTADKEPILLAMLTCASFLKFERIRFKKFIVMTLLGSMCVLVAVTSFNIYRTHIPIGDIISKFPWSTISFTRLDPGGPMVSISSVLSDDYLQLSYGSTYLNSLGVLIPRLLWPGRPVDLSEEFARDNIGDWSIGRGLGYSPLAEAYVNFHIPGAFIHFFIFGLLIGGLLRVLRKQVLIKYGFLHIPFIYIVAYYIVIISFRASIISPIKMVMMFMIPYCILFMMIIFFSKVARESNRNNVMLSANT